MRILPSAGFGGPLGGGPRGGGRPVYCIVEIIIDFKLKNNNKMIDFIPDVLMICKDKNKVQQRLVWVVLPKQTK